MIVLYNNRNRSRRQIHHGFLLFTIYVCSENWDNRQTCRNKVPARCNLPPGRNARREHSSYTNEVFEDKAKGNRVVVKTINSAFRSKSKYSWTSIISEREINSIDSRCDSVCWSTSADNAFLSESFVQTVRTLQTMKSNNKYVWHIAYIYDTKRAPIFRIVQFTVRSITHNIIC